MVIAIIRDKVLSFSATVPFLEGTLRVRTILRDRVTEHGQADRLDRVELEVIRYAAMRRVRTSLFPLRRTTTRPWETLAVWKQQNYMHANA